MSNHVRKLKVQFDTLIYNGKTPLAYQWLPELTGVDAGKPPIIWLGGFRSDMTGSKAERLYEWALKTGTSFFTVLIIRGMANPAVNLLKAISGWVSEAKFLIEYFAKRPAILVGSSMGAWIALNLLKTWSAIGNNKQELAGMVLLAPAPDFTRL